MLSANPNRFDITPNGQQIHIAVDVSNDTNARRHPCFKVDSMEDLNMLRARVYDHYVRAQESSPLEADKPGNQDSGKIPSPEALKQKIEENPEASWT